MRRAALLFAAALLLLLVPAAAGAEDAPDLKKITPEDLVPGNPRALVLEAERAYQEKRYEDAARSYVEALRMRPRDGTSLYNLACCFALMGSAEQAGRFLEAAFAAGFEELDLARQDPDFAKARQAEAFRASMKRIEDAARDRALSEGAVGRVTAEYVAEYRVVAPDPAPARGERAPLVVALHGLGDSAPAFAGLFARHGVRQPFFFVAIEAPYATSTGGAGVGYSWQLRGGPGGDESAALSIRLVLSVIAAVKREHAIDERKVFLMGFSQGAGMAFRIGLQHPDLFAGVIPVGGWLEAGEHTESRMRAAAVAGTKFLVCHGKADQVIPFERATQAAAELEKHGIAHELYAYDGAHTLPAALVQRVAAWVKDPAVPAPAPSK
jgi:phospholipase/carboxylesterase